MLSQGKRRTDQRGSLISFERLLSDLARSWLLSGAAALCIGAAIESVPGGYDIVPRISEVWNETNG